MSPEFMCFLLMTEGQRNTDVGRSGPGNILETLWRFGVKISLKTK